MDRGCPHFTPSFARIVLGFILAPLLASGAPFALITAVVFLGDPVAFVHSEHESIIGDTLFIALVGAYPMTLLIGIPVFGLLMGFTPWLGFGPILPVLAGFATAFMGTVGLQALDHAVHRDGYLMAAGVGLDGAFGGFVFWLIVVGLDPRWRMSRSAKPR